MPLLFAFVMGLVAGSRTFLAPAIVSWGLVLHGSALIPGLSQSPLAFMQSSITAWIFALLAIGELIGDKLPSASSRLAPGPLVARVVSGALSGATICAAIGASVPAGAVLGVLGALAGAWVGFTFRTSWSKPLHAPALVTALIEDAIAIGAALFVMSRL